MLELTYYKNHPPYNAVFRNSLWYTSKIILHRVWNLSVTVIDVQFHEFVEFPLKIIHLKYTELKRCKKEKKMSHRLNIREWLKITLKITPYSRILYFIFYPFIFLFIFLFIYLLNVLFYVLFICLFIYLLFPNFYTI